MTDSMPPIKAITFDVYSTLVHNEHALWEETFQEICQTQHLAVDPKEMYKRWRAIEGRFRQERVHHDGQKPPAFTLYADAWCRSFREVFQAMGLPGDPRAAAGMAIRDLAGRSPYAEVLPTLHRLRSTCVKTAVLSNADRSFLDPTLERLGFSFDAVVSSEEVQVYKPDPLPFLKALSKLEVAPEEALHVGDNLAEDIPGAQAAGMRVAWINRSATPRDPSLRPPDYEIRSLEELPGLLGIHAT